MTAAGVLVIGYGNPLRGDDGVGWHAAGLLATDPRLDGAQVLTRHQLAPELAADISRASLVVLVDAAADGDPGSVSVRQIEPRPATPTTWSHHLDPETLAGLAEALYGAVPPIVLVSVAAGSFAEGDGLSSPLQAGAARGRRGGHRSRRRPATHLSRSRQRWWLSPAVVTLRSSRSSASVACPIKARAGGAVGAPGRSLPSWPPSLVGKALSQLTKPILDRVGHAPWAWRSSRGLADWKVAPTIT